MSRPGAPVLLAGNRELQGSAHWNGLALIVLGVILGEETLSVVYDNPHAVGNQGIAFVLVLLGIGAIFAGIYQLLVRRHVRYRAAIGIEEAHGFPGDSKVTRTPLSALERVRVLEQSGEESRTAYAVSLEGPSGKAISLGPRFADREEALEGAVRASCATGLPLDDQDAGGKVVRLRADQAARLPAPGRLEAGEVPWWRQPSAVAIVAANLVPLAGVLWLGWEILPLMLLFWLENIVIGIYTLARMMLAQGSTEAAPGAAKLVGCAFFVVHFGFFSAGHAAIIFALFGPEPAPGGAFEPVEVLLRAVGEIPRHGLGLSVLATFVSHGVLFWTSYLRPRRFEYAVPVVLMMAPYRRVIVLHVVLLTTGFIVTKLGGAVVPLALLVMLKTAMDLGAHLREGTPPLLREYRALVESDGEQRAVGAAMGSAGSGPAGQTSGGRPLSHYLGSWRLAPGEAAVAGWFAGVEFRDAHDTLEASLARRTGGSAEDAIEAVNLGGDAGSVAFIEVRSRGGGLQRILRFTASRTGPGSLEVQEVQFPEGKPKEMQARAFVLRRGG